MSKILMLWKCMVMRIEKNKLILCDLDGTLFDILEVNYQSYKKY